MISGEDIAPTCLAAAGLTAPERMSGKSFLPLLKGEPFEPRHFIFGERGPHGGATFTEHTLSSAMDYSRCVRSDRYKLIYNVTPNIPYSPVDSAGNPGWKGMVAAHEQSLLASEFETLYFTSPRPVYELYDLESDPSELHNLAGQKDTAAIQNGLKEALQEKMILDFDYLPLPIAADPKKEGPAKSAGNGKNSTAVREKMFIEMDKDHDGKLTFDEFRGNRDTDEAHLWFKARDADGDGFLSREEFLSPTVKNPPKRDK